MLFEGDFVAFAQQRAEFGQRLGREGDAAVDGLRVWGLGRTLGIGDRKSVV